MLSAGIWTENKIGQLAPTFNYYAQVKTTCWHQQRTQLYLVSEGTVVLYISHNDWKHNDAPVSSKARVVDRVEHQGTLSKGLIWSFCIVLDSKESSNARSKPRATARAEGAGTASLRTIPHILQWTRFERKLSCEGQGPSMSPNRIEMTLILLISGITSYHIEATDWGSPVLRGPMTRAPARAVCPSRASSWSMQPDRRVLFCVQ